MFSNQSLSIGGFLDSEAEDDILDIVSDSFATYDLKTSIGPLVGTGRSTSPVPLFTASAVPTRGRIRPADECTHGSLAAVLGGNKDGVDLSGLNAVMAVHSPKRMTDGGWRVDRKSVV